MIKTDKPIKRKKGIKYEEMGICVKERKRREKGKSSKRIKRSHRSKEKHIKSLLSTRQQKDRTK